MENFRSPRFIQRYEYVSFDLQNPIQLPANTFHQKRTDYKFVVNSESETHPFDWWNSYLEISFQVNKLADGTAYDDDNLIGLVNSGYSIINQMKCSFNGVHVNDSMNLNLCTHVKNLVSFSKPYSNIATNSFYYLDEVDSTVVAFADTAALALVKYKQTSYVTRHKKIITNQINNIMLSLNKYGFFSSFENEICPNGRVSINITLESSANLIYRGITTNAG